jgi:hypothetical protein
MPGHRYRLIDTAGSEIGMIEDLRDTLRDGDEVQLPDGSAVEILEVYDDDEGRDGGVWATLVVDDAA